MIVFILVRENSESKRRKSRVIRVIKGETLSENVLTQILRLRSLQTDQRRNE